MSRDEFDRLFDPAKTGGQPTAPDPEDNGLYHYPDFEDDPYKDFPLHLYEPPAPSTFERIVAGVCLACIAAAVLLLVLAVVGRAAGAPVMAGPESEQIVAPSCKVASPRGYGSGVLLTLPGKDGLYVLTASHVVEDAVQQAYVTYQDEDGEEHRLAVPARMRCELADGRPFEGTVVFWNPDYERRGADLALLRAESDLEHPRTAILLPEQVTFRLGEPAWYCGWGSGVPASLERTIVNHVGEQLLRVNGNGWYGHSGSGVFVERDGKYVLCGIVTQLAALTPRTPIECEYRLLEFLKDYDRASKPIPKAD